MLLRHLEGGQAFATFEAAVRDLPPSLRGVTPEGAAHSPWQVLEHLRLAQWDILEFSRNPAHRSPKWPEGYWPQAPEPPNAAAWDASVRQFERELATVKQLIADPRRDLFAKIDHPEARAHHTLAREAMLLLEHNGYHLGELIVLRRLLGAWSES
jgi:DinB family protein